MQQEVSKIVIRDTYKSYKEAACDLKKKPVDRKDYLYLAALYNKFRVAKVLDGETITLPARFGFLAVNGKKYKVGEDENGNIKGAGVDWVKTKALRERSEKARLERKRVYFTNTHSDGIVYKFFWYKQRVLIENKSLYSLVMTRTITRFLSKLIFSGKQFATRN